MRAWLAFQHSTGVFLMAADERGSLLRFAQTKVCATLTSPLAQASVCSKKCGEHVEFYPTRRSVIEVTSEWPSLHSPRSNHSFRRVFCTKTIFSTQNFLGDEHSAQRARAALTNSSNSSGFRFWARVMCG